MVPIYWQELGRCWRDGRLVVDRTFNLGKCLVTLFNYKHQGVVHKDTYEHPIMLGPLFFYIGMLSKKHILHFFLMLNPNLKTKP